MLASNLAKSTLVLKILENSYYLSEITLFPALIHFSFSLYLEQNSASLFGYSSSLKVMCCIFFLHFVWVATTEVMWDYSSGLA